MSKPILRQSMVTSFEKCGLGYQFEYEHEIESPPNTNMMMGTVMDDVNNQNCKNKIETGEWFSLEKLLDLAYQRFDKEVLFTKFREDDEKPDELRAELPFLILVYHHVLVPKLRPVSIQRPFTLETKYEFDLAGTLDIEEENHMVSDLKISGSMDNYEITGEVQPAFYSLAYQAKYGVLPKFRYLVIVRPNMTEIEMMNSLIEGKVKLSDPVPAKLKTKNPDGSTMSVEQRLQSRVQFIEGQCTEIDLAGALYAANTVFQQIKHKIYPRASTLGWWCNKKQCNFWDMCKGRKAA